MSALPDPSAEPAVRLRDLTVRFGETTAVEGVTLEVAAGEMFGLLGPNGAGKTTTLRVLTTLLPAGSGTATVFGIAVGAHGATLEDVFRHHTGDQLEAGGDMRNLRQTRRTASRLG